MKKYIFSIILSGVFIFSGCSDFLDQTNPNELTKETYWKNLTQTNATLNSVYAAFRDQDIFLVADEAWRSDEGWPGFGRPTPTITKQYNWYIHNITNSNTDLSKKWSALYKGIFRCNEVIDGLDGLQGTVDEEEWTSQMAQAKFFRGLFYHYLAISFNDGSVVLADHVATSLDEMSKTLSSAQAVETAYMADLEYAYNNLPDKWDSSNEARPSKGTVATILGIHYLYKKEYKTAEVYFKDVITNPAYGYSLVEGDDVKTIFTNSGFFNSESILEINYSAEFNSEYSVWTEFTMANKLGSCTKSTGWFPTGWLAYAYKSEAMDTKDSRNYTDSELNNLPLRAMQSVVLVEDNLSMYYGELAGSQIKTGQWGFCMYKKYTNDDIVTREVNNRSGKNFIVNRLADVYLMYAECMIQDGNYSQAREYMNAIRTRWGIKKIAPNVTQADEAEHDYIKDDKYDTKEGLMDLLMYNDRPLELSTEGYEIRWQDLKRWGILTSRFEDLSKKTYYLHDYKALKLNGKTLNKKLSSIDTIPNLKNGVDVAKSVVDYEYDATVDNINLIKSYYPIPATEITTNPEVN